LSTIPKLIFVQVPPIAANSFLKLSNEALGTKISQTSLTMLSLKAVLSITAVTKLWYRKIIQIL